MNDQNLNEQVEEESVAATPPDASETPGEQKPEAEEVKQAIPADQVESDAAVDQEVEREMLEDLARMEQGERGESDQEPPVDNEAELSVSHVIGEGSKPTATDGEPLPTVKKVQLGEFAPRNDKGASQNIDLLMEVRLPISIELGRTQMAVREILDLGPGSVVELDKLAGEPVDLMVNNKIIAKGEVVVVDENFGLRVTSLLSQEERLKSL